MSRRAGTRWPMYLRRKFATPSELWKATALGWSQSNASRLSAALAFYTVFALGPTLLVAMTFAGIFFGLEAAQRALFAQLAGLVGKEGSNAIEAILATARTRPTGGWATLVGLTTMFLGATGAFVELQGALNTIWGIQRRPQGGIRRFIRERLLSFAMVAGIGFLLLVSLAFSAVLGGLGEFLKPGTASQRMLWELVNSGISLGVSSLLFAMVFKLLPDIRIAWSDVWFGAMLTGLLFNIGKSLIGLYLGRSGVNASYGPAGSLALVMLWVYYSSQILFLGAHFTRAYAQRRGSCFDKPREARRTPAGQGEALRG